MRIAIVALNASPLVLPKQHRRIGGLETFAWNLARGVATQGRDQVLFLVRSETKCSNQGVEPLEVSSIYEPLRSVRQSVSKLIEIETGRRWPRLKKLEPRLIWQIPVLAVNKLFGKRYDEQQAIYSSLDRFRPDLVLSLGVNETSSMLADYATNRGIASILWLQSNADLDAKLFQDKTFVDRYGVSSHHALKCFQWTKNIICQTETQHRLFASVTQTFLPSSVFHSIHIPNPVDTLVYCPQGSNAEKPIGGASSLTDANRRGVLWIGRADRFHKRPLLALNIAQKCPDILFTMIINAGESEVMHEIRSSKPANVELIEYSPSSEMPSRMRGAKLFLSTGSAEYEGFPNVLLEAAASGTPIVSLEDFDGFLCRSGAGVSGSVEDAASQIQRLDADQSRWRELSIAAREYVSRNHNQALIVEGFQRFAIEATQRQNVASQK